MAPSENGDPWRRMWQLLNAAQAEIEQLRGLLNDSGQLDSVGQATTPEMAGVAKASPFWMVWQGDRIVHMGPTLESACFEARVAWQKNSNQPCWVAAVSCIETQAVVRWFDVGRGDGKAPGDKASDGSVRR